MIPPRPKIVYLGWLHHGPYASRSFLGSPYPSGRKKESPYSPALQPGIQTSNRTAGKPLDACLLQSVHHRPVAAAGRGCAAADSGAGRVAGPDGTQPAERCAGTECLQQRRQHLEPVRHLVSESIAFQPAVGGQRDHRQQPLHRHGHLHRRGSGQLRQRPQQFQLRPRLWLPSGPEPGPVLRLHGAGLVQFLQHQQQLAANHRPGQRSRLRQHHRWHHRIPIVYGHLQRGQRVQPGRRTDPYQQHLVPCERRVQRHHRHPLPERPAGEQLRLHATAPECGTRQQLLGCKQLVGRPGLARATG